MMRNAYLQVAEPYGKLRSAPREDQTCRSAALPLLFKTTETTAASLSGSISGCYRHDRTGREVMYASSTLC